MHSDAAHAYAGACDVRVRRWRRWATVVQKKCPEVRTYSAGTSGLELHTIAPKALPQCHRPHLCSCSASESANPQAPPTNSHPQPPAPSSQFPGSKWAWPIAVRVRVQVQTPMDGGAALCLRIYLVVYLLLHRPRRRAGCGMASEHSKLALGIFRGVRVQFRTSAAERDSVLRWKVHVCACEVCV